MNLQNIWILLPDREEDITKVVNSVIRNASSMAEIMIRYLTKISQFLKDSHLISVALRVERILTCQGFNGAIMPKGLLELNSFYSTIYLNKEVMHIKKHDDSIHFQLYGISTVACVPFACFPFE
jgi:hypothetical protein